MRGVAGVWGGNSEMLFSGGKRLGAFSCSRRGRNI